MSYTKTLAAAVLAGTLSLATSTQAQDILPDMDLLQNNPAEATAQSLFLLNMLLPPEIKSLVADATIKAQATLSADAAGNLSTSFNSLSIENLNCTALEALIGPEMPSEMEKSMMQPEDRLMVDYVETLFADRRLTVADKFDKATILAQMSPAELALVPSKVEINVSVTCNDFVEPAPTMTPVEPN